MAKKEKGFSLVEIVIAIIIMATGLVALAGALVVGITLPKRARQQEVAKQLANEIMESIIFAKESQPSGYTTFDAISYADSNSLGRFISSSGNANITKMLVAGPDGVYGTCDDGNTSTAFIDCAGSGAGNLGTTLRSYTTDPGSDGDYSTTSGNGSNSLVEYSRQVIITDLTPAPVSAKQVEVNVSYKTAIGNTETVKLVCRLTNFKTL
jgi:prepilin-type N-terminal cleavage/methylation domain-containing protein